MIVQFYNQQQNGRFMYSEAWSMLMAGTGIKYSGKMFRVLKTEWIDKAKGILKAICAPQLNEFKRDTKFSEPVMKVEFYVKQTDGKTTSETFLFSNFWGMLMTGNQVTHAGSVYQVDMMEWIDLRKGILKAVCLEVPACTRENEETTR